MAEVATNGASTAKKYPRGNVSYDKMREFIRVWWQSDTLDEVAERTGLGKRQAANLAVYLRGVGVPLEYMSEKSTRWGIRLTKEQARCLVRLGEGFQQEAAGYLEVLDRENNHER